MCPLTCSIVKEAIKAHEERGIIMGEYVDYCKGTNSQCAMCIRNEKATVPYNMLKDYGNTKS